jgi:hypothetical protein
LNQAQASFWHRHRGLLWLMMALAAVLSALAVAVSVIARRAEPLLRAYIVSELEQYFHARVELDALHVSLARGLRAEGQGLRIWPAAQLDSTEGTGSGQKGPLFSLEEFSFRAPLHYAPGRPIHVSVVDLKGLTVDIPPKKPAILRAGERPGGAGPSGIPAALIHLSVESIDCSDVHLLFERSDPARAPLEIPIASLKLSGIGAGSTMKFKARLTNPRPEGKILTQGTFGPWRVDDPGATPVAGTYEFKNANLADFRGIRGTLSSTGSYQGPLRELTVDGQTDTPDFALTRFGTPMKLETRFRADVDATSGDTRLEPVEATLGQSRFTVRGKIVRASSAGGRNLPEPPAKGHEIALEVDVPRGRMEDFLRLTSSNGKPALSGWLALKASLQIPPGKEPVHQRMQLKGSFVLTDGQFANPKIQDRITELSLRGQGKPQEAKHRSDEADVHWAMQGDFTMRQGIVTLPDLKYSLPGADIALSGTYTVSGSALAFTGSAKMQATVSQMVGGWKGWLLKPADRLFKKDGAGTDVPIRVSGTAKDPQIGIELNRLKSTTPERPDQKP